MSINLSMGDILSQLFIKIEGKKWNSTTLNYVLYKLRESMSWISWDKKFYNVAFLSRKLFFKIPLNGVASYKTETLGDKNIVTEIKSIVFHEWNCFEFLTWIRQINWVYATNSNFIVSIFLQTVGVNLWFSNFRYLM